MKIKIIIGIGLMSVLSMASCKKGPKVIEASEDKQAESLGTGIFSDEGNNSPTQLNSGTINGDVHSVVVEEILPTSKYVYLYVKEGNDKFWIATIKKDVQVGKAYFYKGGLLKTNFESKEHNRVFDKIYLVSNIVESDHGGSMSNPVSSAPNNSNEVRIASSEIVEVKGSIKIAELVNNAGIYEGKVVQISGKCVKLNPNIMGRNWIHLQDGSKDDFDLVITSEIPIPEGTQITMEGKVVLNKDFGAGYRYDIILEEGKIVK